MGDKETTQKLEFKPSGKAAEDRIKFGAFSTKVMNKLISVELHTVVIHGSNKDGETASSADKARAWRIITDPINDDNLVVELTERFADLDSITFDPKSAFAYLRKIYGGKVDMSEKAKMEKEHEDYNELVSTGFSEKPSEDELRTIINKMNTLVANLKGTKREKTGGTFALDMVKMTEKCHSDVHNAVIKEIDELDEDAHEDEDPRLVETAIKNAISNSVRKLAGREDREAANISALMTKIEKQMESKMSAMKSKCEALEKDLIAAKAATGREDLKKCDTCGRVHLGLCAMDIANINKIKWHRLPSYVVNLAKKKLGADKVEAAMEKQKAAREDASK